MSDESGGNGRRVPQEVAAALLKAQKAVGSVGQDQRNNETGKWYTSAENMITYCRDILLDAGLVFTRSWRIVGELKNRNEDLLMVVMFINITHAESGKELTDTIELPAVSHKGKFVDKAVQTALTSSLTYYLRDLLLVPRGGDDNDKRQDGEVDKNSAPTSGQQPRQDSPRSQPQTRPAQRVQQKASGTQAKQEPTTADSDKWFRDQFSKSPKVAVATAMKERGLSGKDAAMAVETYCSNKGVREFAELDRADQWKIVQAARKGDFDFYKGRGATGEVPPEEEDVPPPDNDTPPPDDNEPGEVPDGDEIPF